MAVKIRLARLGKRKKPLYRIIAVDESKKSHAAESLEILGTYDPLAKTGKITLDKARVDYWLKVGAKPSETAKSLIKKTT